MSLPSGCPTVTVTCGPLTDAEGGPCTGSAVVTPSTPVVWTATGQILHDGPIYHALDAAGTCTVVLPATDAAGLTVQGFTYTFGFVAHAVSGAVVDVLPVTVQLPHAAPAVTLGLLAHVETSTGIVVALPTVLSVAGLSGSISTGALATAMGLGTAAYAASTAFDAAGAAATARAASVPIPAGTPAVGQVPVVSSSNPLLLRWGSAETEVNVRDYGAKGDSDTDDIAAIVAADAALPAIGGKLYFPAGYYGVSSTPRFRQGVTYYGDGPLVSVIQQHTANADGVAFNDAHTGATIRVRIEGLQIAAVGAAFHTGYGAGISGGASTNVLVDCALRDVWVQGFGGWGIVLTTIITSTLDSVSASDNGRGTAAGGICLYGTGGYTPTSTHLNNCYSNNNVGIGYNIVDTNYSALVACAADTNHQGYQIVGGMGVSLISCGTEDMRAVGSDGGGHGTGDGFTIVGGTGHVLQGCMSVQNPHVGFYVTASARSVSLISCTEQSTTGTPVAGIMVEPGSKATVISPSTVTNPVYAAGTTTLVGTGKDTFDAAGSAAGLAIALGGL